MTSVTFAGAPGFLLACPPPPRETPSELQGPCAGRGRLGGTDAGELPTEDVWVSPAALPCGLGLGLVLGEGEGSGACWILKEQKAQCVKKKFKKKSCRYHSHGR